MTGYLFEDCDLPEGFKFPAAFVELMSLDVIPYYEPWWFLTKFPDEAREWLEALQEDLPALKLIPFAKYGIDPEVVCFDASDLSGDPPIRHVIADWAPAPIISRSERNFVAWLDVAKQDSAAWHADRLGR